MARVFVTGSADGLGRSAAAALLDEEHEVVVHVRGNHRLPAVADLVDRGAMPVVGDLSNQEEIRGIAKQVNSLGKMDAVIHNAGTPSLAALGTRTGSVSYSDSKLFVTTLAAAVARLWPDVCSSAVDPGWVPTRMGGPGAPDDLELGRITQVWLATSADPRARTSGRYWHHQRIQSPHPAVGDERFQDELLDALGRLTSVQLPRQPKA